MLPGPGAPAQTSRIPGSNRPNAHPSLLRSKMPHQSFHSEYAGPSANIDAALAKRVSTMGVLEAHLKQHMYAKPSDEQRVCIVGLTERRDLNGRYGMAGAPQGRNGGRRLVVLEDGGGASVSLPQANLQLAPPKPEDVVYNGGTGGYQRRVIQTKDNLPRRLRPGSGRPAHSTAGINRRPKPPPLEPPQAGALLPRYNPPTEFSEAFNDGTLPVRISGAQESGELRWIDPLTGGEVPKHRVDVRKWLPLLLDGLRDQSVSGAYVALRGALELCGSASRAKALPPLMPSCARAFKAALDMRERSVVCAALRLLILVIRADNACGLALRPHYKMLLPALGAFKVASKQPNLFDEIEYSQHRGINVLDLVDEALEVLEEFGGLVRASLSRAAVGSQRMSSCIGVSGERVSKFACFASRINRARRSRSIELRGANKFLLLSLLQPPMRCAGPST